MWVFKKAFCLQNALSGETGTGTGGIGVCGHEAPSSQSPWYPLRAPGIPSLELVNVPPLVFLPLPQRGARIDWTLKLPLR